jgi:hypothetical protein
MANDRQETVNVLALGLINRVGVEWCNSSEDTAKVQTAHSEMNNDEDVDLFNFHCDMNDRPDLLILV